MTVRRGVEGGAFASTLQKRQNMIGGQAGPKGAMSWPRRAGTTCRRASDGAILRAPRVRRGARLARARSSLAGRRLGRN